MLPTFSIAVNIFFYMSFKVCGREAMDTKDSKKLKDIIQKQKLGINYVGANKETR